MGLFSKPEDFKLAIDALERATICVGNMNLYLRQMNAGNVRVQQARIRRFWVECQEHLMKLSPRFKTKFKTKYKDEIERITRALTTPI